MMPVGPRHALRSEPVIPWPRHGDPGRRAYEGEPPAGLGAWVPPLPAPQPGLSRRMGVLLTASVLGLVAATVTVIDMDVQQTAAQHAAAAPSAEAMYLNSVRANSTLSAVSDTDLVSAGHAVCSTLDAHPTRLGLFGTLDRLTGSNGWSAGDAAAIVGSAVGALCPEHRSLLG